MTLTSSTQRILITTLCALLLVACDKKDKPPLVGTRLAIDAMGDVLRADEDLKGTVITLPDPATGPTWPQAGGEADHAMPPVFLAATPAVAWSTSVGSGLSSGGRILSGPVSGGGKVFTIDSDSTITAIDAKSGDVLWSTSSAPEDKNDAVLGGGVAYDGGNVYAATAFAEIVAMDAKTGAIAWRKPLSSPSRAAPTVADGRIYVTTINNFIEVFSAKTGKKLWHHCGVTESAGLLGAASPAVKNSIVVAAFTSGELFALKSENGHPLWDESFQSAGLGDAASALPHIKARPIIDGQQIFVVSNGGRMASFELRTGKRLWERTIGGMRTPAVAGDFLFLITNNSDLVCMTKTHGGIAWIEPLPKADPDNTKDKILWAGPVLAGPANALKLYVCGSNGQILAISPQNGKVLNIIDIGESLYLSPIVSDGTLYVLSDAGNLYALR